LLLIMSERFRPQPENPKPNASEAGEGSRGAPTAQQPSQPEQTQPLQGRAAGKESLQGPTTVDESGQPLEGGQDDSRAPKKKRKKRAPLSPEAREKIVAANRGKTLSSETREKISQSQLESWRKRWKQKLAERKMKSSSEEK
jgi:NUMOD3 motif